MKTAFNPQGAFGTGKILTLPDMDEKGENMTREEQDKLVPGTREYYEEAVRDISEQLKGPMSNLERELLVLDRKDFRALLSAMPESENVNA